MKSDKARSVLTGAFALSGLAGGLIVLASTQRCGLGVSADSINYVAAARSLLAGKGYLCWTGEVFENWPPLYPTILAAFRLVGMEPVSAARILNAAVYAALVFATGQLLLGNIRSVTLRVVGVLSVLFSPALLDVSLKVWSDSLFALLIVLFLISLPRYLEIKKPVLLGAVSTLAALACLQRYAGVAVIATGVVAILCFMSKTPRTTRLKCTAAFLVVSATPLALWMLRNYVEVSRLAGNRGPSNVSLVTNAMRTFRVIAAWFIPDATLPGGIFVVAVIVVVLVAVTLKVRRAVGGRVRLEAACTGLFVSLFVGLLLYSATTYSMDAIGDRLLAPVYIPLLYLLIVMIDNSVQWLARSRRPAGKCAAYGALALCALWLYYPCSATLEKAQHHARHGWGYTGAVWKESSLIEWLQAHPLDGVVYSNGPDALYILTSTASPRWSPSNDRRISKLKKHAASRATVYLVWFNSIGRKRLCGLDEISSRLKMKPIKEFPEGGVYLVKG